MAGAFALMLRGEWPDGGRVARLLSQAMTLFPHQRAGLLEVEPGRVWLGAVVNGPTDGELSGALRREGALAAAVEGWLLRSREACGAEDAISRQNYAGAVIAAFGAGGERFAARLEGQFNALVYDARARRLWAGNGRHAHSPLYVAESEDYCVLATNLGPLAATGLFDPRLDAEAVSIFLTYDQHFGQRCLLEGVRVLDSGSVLHVDLEGGRAQSRRYWSIGDIPPPREGLTRAQHVAELRDVVLAAGRLTCRRPGRYVVGLSGGLDSRLNLAAVLGGTRELRAWTFGAPDAPDVTVAADICRMLGIEHLVYSLDPSLVPKHAVDFVTSVDGSMTVQFAYQMERARDLGQRADVVLNGFAGEVLVRGILLDLKEKDWLPYLKYRAGLGPATPHPKVERNLDLDAVMQFTAKRHGPRRHLDRLVRVAAPNYATLIQDDLRALSRLLPWERLAEAWIWEHRGRRWTIMGIVSDRHFYQDGSIFYDYDLVDYCFSVPTKVRRGGPLYAPLLRALSPALASIPSGNTGLPIAVSPARALAARVSRRVAIGLGRRGQVATTGADPVKWSRDELRGFWRELVEDPRTQSRSLWNGEELRGLLDAHLRGETDQTALLGQLGAVEFFARRWLDGLPAPKQRIEVGS